MLINYAPTIILDRDHDHDHDHTQSVRNTYLDFVVLVWKTKNEKREQEEVVQSNKVSDI